MKDSTRIMCAALLTNALEDPATSEVNRANFAVALNDLQTNVGATEVNVAHLNEAAKFLYDAAFAAGRAEGERQEDHRRALTEAQTHLEIALRLTLAIREIEDVRLRVGFVMIVRAIVTSSPAIYAPNHHLLTSSRTFLSDVANSELQSLANAIQFALNNVKEFAKHAA